MVELSPAAASAEIVALINSRVSSPRQEEIETIVARVSGGECRVAQNDRIGGGRLGLDHDGEPTEWDAIPVSFGDEHLEAYRNYLPWIQMAFLMLSKDHVGVRETVRAVLEDETGKGDEMASDMLGAWNEIAHKFDNLSKFVAVAHTRALISLYVVAPDRPAEFKIIDIAGGRPPVGCTGGRTDDGQG